MKKDKIEITNFENKDWNTFTINSKYTTFVFESSNDDLSVECNHNNGNELIFINQLELKQLIEFLQSKVK
jgi:hypothetical protein